MDIDKEIKDKAISLEKYGLNEFAWSADNAIEFLESLTKASVGVYGGDVYQLTSDGLKYLYDNWSCEMFDHESKDSFYARSLRESIKYIKNYPIANGSNILFVLVLTRTFKP